METQHETQAATYARLGEFWGIRVPKDGRPAPHAGQVVTCRKRDGEHEQETVRAIEREYGNCWLCTIEKEARAYPSRRRFRKPPPNPHAPPMVHLTPAAPGTYSAGERDQRLQIAEQELRTAREDIVKLAVRLREHEDTILRLQEDNSRMRVALGGEP